MPILFRIWGDIRKKTENLEASGENIEKGLLEKTDTERLKEISGLSSFEEAFDEVGYSIDTMATEENCTFVIVEKRGKRKPEFSEEMESYMKANFNFHQKLKPENKPKNYEIIFCAYCKDKRALYEILPDYIYLAVNE